MRKKKEKKTEKLQVKKTNDSKLVFQQITCKKEKKECISKYFCESL